MTSAAAAPRFEDGQLDFVYIDANHSYAACRQDIELWWPKLRSGGLLAGHDYLDAVLESGVYGVKSAVDEFAASCGANVLVTPEKSPTWYLLKQP